MGFEVKLDASWIILALLITWSLAVGYFPSATPGLPKETYWLMAAIAAVSLFLSIVIHEFAHSVAARSQGLPMRESRCSSSAESRRWAASRQAPASSS